MSFDVEYESFDGTLDPWILSAAQISHRFPFAKVIGRVNRARRFNQDGTQFEIDSYPRIAKGLYAYVNAGFSRDGIFPDQRYGGEIYKSLPHSFETSLGFRRLNFSSSSVTLYTGTVGKYKGDMYYFVRPYVSRDDTGTSWSGHLTVRKYFSDHDEYASFSGGYGSSPTEDIAPDLVNRLGSWSVRTSMQRLITKRVMLSGRVGYRNDEIRRDSRRRSWYAAMGIERRF